MSSRSDVVFACREQIKKSIDDCFPWVRKDSEYVLTDNQGILFHFVDVNWDLIYDEDINALYRWLDSQNAKDFIIIEACYDYPNSDSGNLGEWTENPWNIRKAISVSIEYIGN
jgi:hypothetical protein